MLCGLCGNGNDRDDDEWRMNTNELATNIKSFHQSYTLQEDSECTQDQKQRFYNSFENNSQKSSSEEENKGNFFFINICFLVDPIERTIITEYNHKICFSKKLVKQCSKNSYPKQQSLDSGNRREKVSFACLNRDSVEAKQIKKSVRKFGTSEKIANLSVSFVEFQRIPTECVQY